MYLGQGNTGLPEFDIGGFLKGKSQHLNLLGFPYNLSSNLKGYELNQT
jgi:hypothetical protein